MRRIVRMLRWPVLVVGVLVVLAVVVLVLVLVFAVVVLVGVVVEYLAAPMPWASPDTEEQRSSSCRSGLGERHLECYGATIVLVAVLGVVGVAVVVVVGIHSKMRHYGALEEHLTTIDNNGTNSNDDNTKYCY